MDKEHLESKNNYDTVLEKNGKYTITYVKKGVDKNKDNNYGDNEKDDDYSKDNNEKGDDEGNDEATTTSKEQHNNIN